MVAPESRSERFLREEASDARNSGLVVNVQEVFFYGLGDQAFELLPLNNRRSEKQNHAVDVTLTHGAYLVCLHVRTDLVSPLLEVPVVSPSAELSGLKVSDTAAAEVSKKLLIGSVEP